MLKLRRRPVPVEAALDAARSAAAAGDESAALKQLERARRVALAGKDLEGLEAGLALAGELELGDRGARARQRDLVYAFGQNIRFLSRQRALAAGQEWQEPLAGAPLLLPPTPPLSRSTTVALASTGVMVVAGLAAVIIFSGVATRLTHWWSCNSGDEGAPSFSPDGTMIAFAKRDSGCDTHIYVMSAGGAGLRRLTDASGRGDSMPVWTPDGTTIAFAARGWSGYYEVGSAGGHARRLIRGDSPIGLALAPDGRWIAFTRETGGFGFEVESSLYVARTDGRDKTRLLGSNVNPDSPAWSPDARRLAVGGSDGIYVINRDGSNLQRITTRGSNGNGRPAWSPDGRTIAFGLGNTLMLINADGTHLRTITTVPGSQSLLTDPSWKPDGRWIAFSITHSHEDGIYLIHPNGSGRRRIAAF
jgi:hypothetical protein